MHRSRHDLTRKKEKNMARTAELFDMGMSDKEIAHILDIHPDTVGRYRMEQGLYRRWGRAQFKRQDGEVYTKPILDRCDPKPSAHLMKRKVRKCLKCQTKFISHHAGERVCTSCRNSAAWRSGGDFSMDSRL